MTREYEKTIRYKLPIAMDHKAEVKKPQYARLAGSNTEATAEATAGDRTVTEQPVRRTL